MLQGERWDDGMAAGQGDAALMPESWVHVKSEKNVEKQNSVSYPLFFRLTCEHAPAFWRSGHPHPEQ